MGEVCARDAGRRMAREAREFWEGCIREAGRSRGFSSRFCRGHLSRNLLVQQGGDVIAIGFLGHWLLLLELWLWSLQLL